MELKEEQVFIAKSHRDIMLELTPRWVGIKSEKNIIMLLWLQINLARDCTKFQKQGENTRNILKIYGLEIPEKFASHKFITFHNRKNINTSYSKTVKKLKKNDTILNEKNSDFYSKWRNSTSIISKLTHIKS